MTRYHVLSLKQPWAALLAAGRKTVEVRRWRTAYRGLVLIHAARVPDPREEAWGHVTPDLDDQARLGGGVVGVGVLSAVASYRTAEAFALEKGRHLNEPDWFEPAGLFGFSFADLRPTPFRRLVGQVRLFSCEMDDFVIPDAPRPVASSGRAERIRRSLSRFAAPPRGGEPA